MVPRALANSLVVCFSLAYPVGVYFGLQVMQPRWFGLLILLVLLLRHGQAARRFLSDVRSPEWLAFGGLGVMALGIMATNSVQMLLFYPAAVSVSLLMVFYGTLLRPPSMIERIARLTEPDLPPQGVLYTRRVTMVWCGFFVVNGSLAVLTAFMSREWWVLYNGLLSYIAMGVLFAGEWFVRIRVRHRSS